MFRDSEGSGRLSTGSDEISEVSAIRAAAAAEQQQQRQHPEITIAMAGVYKMTAWDKSGRDSTAADEAASPTALKAHRHSAGKISGQQHCRRVMCHVLPVLLVLCLAGAGLAIWQTVGKQEQKALAVPAGEPLTFSVNMKLPQDAAGSTCSGLFYKGKGGDGGGSVPLKAFLDTFGKAFGSALDMPPSSVKVSSVACDGLAVSGVSNSSSSGKPAAPAAAAAVRPSRRRSLLDQNSSSRSSSGYLAFAAAAAAAAVSPGRRLAQEGPTPAVLTTVFSVPAPGDADRQAELINKITQHSDEILTKPMSELFRVPVEVEEPAYLRQNVTPDVTAAAAQTTGPVIPAPLPSVEAGNSSNATEPSGTPLLPTTTFRPSLNMSDADAAAAAAAAAAAVAAAAKVQPPSPSPSPPAVSKLPKKQKPRGAAAAADTQPDQQSVSADGHEPETRPGFIDETEGPPEPGSALTVVWAMALTCDFVPTPRNSEPDRSGRLWGWQGGASCAFRSEGSDGQPQPVQYTWDNADVCKKQPDASNSIPDMTGNLWGWQNGRSCAFRGYDDGSVSSAAVNSFQETFDSEQSATCQGRPNPVNSVAAGKGMLWGWEGGQRCVYRNGYYKQPQWSTAPECAGRPTVYTSVKDTEGRLWGWENEASCRFV
ncbi:hypothetical protein OEZ85_005590 [Tetradesmus obliquus]|uniref:Uncharacterized protein n=1 Tax=Tetradesmus obliquus TaxID=3088 RepID=A0ABY8UDX2_TETOB|nr:hypothetical protein OEZ85_005590 [Tetradesmus obliquus]